MHITEKVNQFTSILCPDPTCGKKIDPNSSIFSQIPPHVLDKLEKYEEFK